MQLGRTHFPALETVSFFSFDFSLVPFVIYEFSFRRSLLCPFSWLEEDRKTRYPQIDGVPFLTRLLTWFLFLFAQVRSIVVEVRRTISVSNLEQFSLLQEFATIHWNVFATRPAAVNGLDEAISVYIENLRQKDIQTLFNALWHRSGFIRWSLVENKTGV